MRDMIITSSILILAILVIRHLVKDRIHPLLQYSLWLLVVLKLLIPIPLWSSQVSVLNLFPASLEKEETSAETPLFSQDKTGAQGIQNIDGQAVHDTDAMTDTDSLLGMTDAGFLSDTDDETPSSGISDAAVGTVSGLSLSAFLTFIWLAGMMAVGGYMIFYQVKWQYYLRTNRKLLSASYNEVLSALGIPLSVYIVNGLPSPCLSGRSIYLTEEMAGDEKQLVHILAHEYCHYRQFDSLWVIVRCVLTVVYWFNPFVWAAAYISKRDSEFACDAAVIRMLGENERIAYGKTLINLISVESFGGSRIGAAPMLSGGEKGIRERIFKIAGKKKYIAVAAGIVILIAAALTAVTFSGEWRENAEEPDANAQQIETQHQVEELERKQQEALAKELEEIKAQEAAIQAEMEARQAEAEALQAEMAARQAAEEEQQPELKGTVGVQNEADLDLSVPLRSENIALLLSQAEYVEIQPHQSAMQLRYSNPCPSYTRISDTFGTRVDPITNEKRVHEGVDMAAGQGDDILAAAWGIVCKTGYDSQYGNYVVIYHGMEEFTYYTCCDEILAAEGDRVESGQKIATVGSTGMSTGAHLHFMFSVNGEYVEPVFQ